MGHPDDTCYHVLLKEYEGTHIDDALISIPGDPFNGQRSYDQTGTYVIIDCKSSNPISTYSQLDNYVIPSPPSWITSIAGLTPENTSYANAIALRSSIGDPNTAWGAPIESIG